MSHLITISNNLIDKVETGIFIQNQTNATISGNNITFSRGGSGIGYGIRANNDADLLIQDNYISSNCSTCALNRMCVHATDCSGLVLDGNYFNFSTVGAMIYASAINGNMYCNEFHDCRVGVGLEDIDVSLFGGFDFGVLEGTDYYINHSAGIAADNSWYPSATANRERHFGATDVNALNWRYRDVLSDLITPAPHYNIPAALTVPALGSIDQFTAVLTNTTAPECGYLFRMSDITSMDEALEYMEQVYSNADDLIDAELSASEYYRRWQFWRDAHSWDGLIELLSDDLTAYTETIASTHIPKFMELTDSIGAGNYAIAAELLSSISPANPVDEAIHQAYNIYLSRVDSNGKYTLTEEDQATLLVIAQSDPNEYGMGVHIAAALLDTTLHRSYEIEDEGDFDVMRQSFSPFAVYPNPVSDLLHVELFESDQGVITLYNFSGTLVGRYNIKTGRLDVNLSTLADGVYLLEINTLKGDSFKEVLIKN
jgi:hypothetical protein